MSSDYPAPIRLRILGPLRIWRDDVELRAGPRQQAYLLALLLAREGRPTSTDELVDLIWQEDAPVSAVNVIHKHVGALRRLLEPALRTRKAGSYILRRGNGYQCAAGPGALDLVDFRDLVAAARIHVEEQRQALALDLYVEALGLWHGPAGDGMAHSSAAIAIFAQLNDEFLDASVAAAELAVALGQPERVLPPLHLAAGMAPFHEPVQASLITALGAAGQQAEALSVFRTVRARLADELGIDPGQALNAAHRRVIRQEPTSSTERAKDVFAAGRRSATPAPHGQPASAVDDHLVGRADELAVLRQAVDRAAAGDNALVFVEGEPGVGKTRLLEEVAAGAAGHDALVVWSHCLDGDGTPPMWPWVQVVETMLGRLTAEVRHEWLVGELGWLMAPRDDALPGQAPDEKAQFRLFEGIVTLLGNSSVQRPLVLVIDDLQWADAASLRLLAHVSSRLPRGTVLLGALRHHALAPSSELAKVLAVTARVPAHRRVVLGPLNLVEVAELVRRETGHPTTEAVARSLLDRTDGNPLFVQELSRFLSDGGELTEEAAAQSGVPATVRDVVLDVVSRLDEDTQELLQLAAVIGRQVDLGLLARSSGRDIHGCLERLEAVEKLGLLAPIPDDPFSQRFDHDLVRESVAASVPPRRAARLHLRVADAMQVDESVVEQLAHHLWAAGPLADPTRTVGALVQSGRRAAARTALDTAERQLRSAVQAARTADLADLELSALSELIAVVGMSSPHGTAALELQERAEQLAVNTGRPEEAAILQYSRWMALAYGGQYGRSEIVARRLLEQSNRSDNPVIRGLGLQAWGLQEVSVGNIGEAFRYLTEASAMLSGAARREGDAVWQDHQLNALGMLAETTAVHGDVTGARALLDRLESLAGDDSYKVTVWAVHSVRIASVVGDAEHALAATRKGIAADPDLSFGFFGMYQRLARFWALAMTGQDPSGSAAEVERLITENLLDPPRSDIATWYGLLAEMRLFAGALEDAAVALDLADQALDAYGQRYSEGLILLMRARLLQAQNEPAAAVTAAAQAAKELSASREAHLFAQRSHDFLSSLNTSSTSASARPSPSKVV